MKPTTTTTTALAKPAAALRDPFDHLKFSLDLVKSAVGALDPEQRELILWLFNVAKSSGWNQKQTGERIGYSSTTVYRIFSGTYEGNVASVCEAIARFRKLYTQREAGKSPDFVETSLWKRISQACDFALISNSVVFLWGESQIGKTACLREHQRRNNHGQTRYAEIPASPSILLVAQEIARACNVSIRSNYPKLRERIFRALDADTLLIVDEIQLVFTTCTSQVRVRILEFIREIYRRTNCGLVLVGTNYAREELDRGPERKILAQLTRRGVVVMQVEDVPAAKDLAQFFAFYRLDPPTGRAATIVHDIIHTHGLGKLLKFLQASSRRAAKQDHPVGWDDFVATHDTITALSAPKRR